MRLLLWVLLATLVTLLSSADALSTTNSDKKQLSVLDSGKDATSRMLTADYELTNVKRSLRGESEKTEEDEERMGRIWVKIKELVQKLKDQIRAGMEKQYEKLDTIDKKTPDDLLEEYKASTWATNRLKKKAYKGYYAWYMKKHPTWVSSSLK